MLGCTTCVHLCAGRSCPAPLNAEILLVSERGSSMGALRSLWCWNTHTASVCTKQLEEDLVVEGWREGEGDSKCISRAPLDRGQSSRPGVAPQRWGGLCCLCRLSLRKAICFQEAPQWETFFFLYISLLFFSVKVREKEREREEGKIN